MEIDRIGPDDEERLARHEARDPQGGRRRFATRAEIQVLRDELDAKRFPVARAWSPTEGPNWTVQRLHGAQGD